MSSTTSGQERRESPVARLRGAPVTSALLLAFVLVFVASALRPELVDRLAKVSARVRAGELWRLVTANFLHGSIAHLAMNGFALYVIGPTVERLYGRLALLSIFLVGGAAGFAASTALVAAPSLGASAGLFALLGALLGFAARERRRIPPPARLAIIREILTVAGINLAIGLILPFIDNAAHVGGFTAGVVLGLALRPRALRGAGAAQ